MCLYCQYEMDVWFELANIGWQSCCILSLSLKTSCSCESLLVSLGWCRLPTILYCNFKAPWGELGWKLCFCHATIREKFLCSDISGSEPYRSTQFFLNFAYYYVLSCLSNVDNIKNFTIGFLNYKPLRMYLKVFS